MALYSSVSLAAARSLHCLAAPVVIPVGVGEGDMEVEESPVVVELDEGLLVDDPDVATVEVGGGAILVVSPPGALVDTGTSVVVGAEVVGVGYAAVLTGNLN